MYSSSKAKGGSKAKSAMKQQKHKIVNIGDVARDAALFNCDCKKMCLAKVGGTIPESVSLLSEYMTPWIHMDKKEHRNKFFSLLEGCARGITPGRHLNKRYGVKSKIVLLLPNFA